MLRPWPVHHLTVVRTYSLRNRRDVNHMIRNEFLKARQMAFYFQQYRELPGVKRQRLDPDETLEEFEHFKFLLNEYRSLDNTPEDYDPRPCHLLLADEHCVGRAMQISYQGDEKEGRISRVLVDEPRGRGFQEDHLILADETYHTLTVSPVFEHGWLLEASHWNRSEPKKSQQQTLTIGRKEGTI